jgi:hypothetical protein
VYAAHCAAGLHILCLPVAQAWHGAAAVSAWAGGSPIYTVLLCGVQQAQVALRDLIRSSPQQNCTTAEQEVGQLVQ